MVETGDPLAVAERHEVGMKNIGLASWSWSLRLGEKIGVLVHWRNFSSHAKEYMKT